MIYELWHGPSGNLLEELETEAEALNALRGYVAANGPESADDFSLSAVPAPDAEPPPVGERDS